MMGEFQQPIVAEQFERLVSRLLIYGDNKIETVVALRIQRQEIERCHEAARRAAQKTAEAMCCLDASGSRWGPVG